MSLENDNIIELTGTETENMQPESVMESSDEFWEISEEEKERLANEKKVLGKLDIAFGIFLLILGAAYFISAFRMPRGNLGGNFGGSTLALSPGLLPMFVSGVLILLSTVMIIQSVREGSRITGDDVKKALAFWKQKSVQRTALIVLLIFIYAFFGLEYLPYTVATFLFLFLFMFLFKAGSVPRILLISVVVTAALWFFFGKIAAIPLP